MQPIPSNRIPGPGGTSPRTGLKSGFSGARQNPSYHDWRAGVRQLDRLGDFAFDEAEPGLDFGEFLNGWEPLFQGIYLRAYSFESRVQDLLQVPYFLP